MRGNSGGGRHPAGTDRRALRQALPQPDPAGSRSRPAEPGHSLVAESPGGLPVPVSFSRRPKMLIDFGLRKSAMIAVFMMDFCLVLHGEEKSAIPASSALMFQEFSSGCLQADGFSFSRAPVAPVSIIRACCNT